jgi:hypothetical protein
LFESHRLSTAFATEDHFTLGHSGVLVPNYDFCVTFYGQHLDRTHLRALLLKCLRQTQVWC